MWTVIGADLIPKEYRSILRMGCWCRGSLLLPIDSSVGPDGASVRMFCPECRAHYKAFSTTPNQQELEVLRIMPKQTTIAAGSFTSISKIAEYLGVDPEIADTYCFEFFKRHGHANLVGLAHFMVGCMEHECEYIAKAVLENDLMAQSGEALLSRQYIEQWRRDAQA